jgi:hypothetical protein
MMLQLLRKLPVVGMLPPKVMDGICAFALIGAKGSMNAMAKILVAIDLDVTGKVIPEFSFAMPREIITKPAVGCYFIRDRGIPCMLRGPAWRARWTRG